MNKLVTFLALCASGATAFSAVSSFAGRPTASMALRRAARSAGRSNLRMENFGLDFAEDAWAAALSGEERSLLVGEKRLKEQFVPSVQKRSLLTDDYPVLERVGELNLLTLTAESGLLSALDEKGLTLGQLEALLPAAEKLGLLGVAQSPIVNNLVAPLLIEPAPILLPGLVQVIKLDAVVWTGLAAVFLALEANGLASGDGVSIPLLIPVVLFGGLGQLLSGNIGIPDVSDIPSLPSLPSPSSSSSDEGGFSLPSLGALRPRV